MIPRLTALWRQYHVKRWLLLGLLGFLLLLPMIPRLFPEQEWVTNSLIFSFAQTFMLITLASNWNLISGFTGYIDFGHAVFFGLGAYGTAILMVKVGVPFVPAVLGGALAAALFAVGIGWATLRLKGPYFSIAMLGTFVAMREIVRIAKPLTGGGVGMTMPIARWFTRPILYYTTLALAVVVVLFIAWLRRTEFGHTLIAIREDETGAEMRGINTTLHKITAFLLAAFSTGVVGGIWAFENTFVDPDIVFFDSRTVDWVMMTMLGGLGTVSGPVVGATLLYWLRDVVWSNFLQYHLIVQGLLLILIVLFVPTGVVGILGDPSATSLGRLWHRWTAPPENDGVEAERP